VENAILLLDRGREKEPLVGRVSQEQIDRLAAQISIERLVEERGIAMASEGPGLVGVCPWCDTPT